MFTKHKSKTESSPNEARTKMAESRRKIEFETRKRIFDLVGDEGACGFCKIIPRNGPIYQSEKGEIVCSTCKDSKKGKFQQNNVTKLLEKMLSTLPRSCKFKKNGCKIAMDIQRIEYHEEDCDLRDIQCIFCEEIVPASTLFDHLKTDHVSDGLYESFKKELTIDYEKKGSKYIFKSSLEEIHAFGYYSTFTNGLKIQNNVIFALHFAFDEDTSLAKGFVKIIGSKFEALNYKYTIKVEDPVFGNHNYENQVKSLDDKEQEVYETNQCLVLPLQMFPEYIGNDFKLVVEIEDLKPREEDDRQSVESIIGKEKEEK